MDTAVPPTFWGITRLDRVLMGLEQPRQSRPNLGPCTHIPQSMPVWQCHAAAMLPAGPSSVEPNQGCFSTLLTVLQLCSKSHEKGRQQPRILLGSLPHS